LIRGPFRPPPGFKYPQKIIAGHLRRLQAKWFTKYDWLEYSEKVDKCFVYISISLEIAMSAKVGMMHLQKMAWV
jgi:hypothetical protein